MFHATIRLCLSFFVITQIILTPASGQSAITDANWESMGGMPGVDGKVYAMTSDEKGTFYAAGYFRTAGGVFVNNIAKWDGSSWSALGSGTNSNINDITLDKSGNLYVVGNFDTAGGIPANHIAKWDGTAWSSPGSGLAWGGSKTASTVTAVITDATGNVYTAGDFDSAGGVAAKNIAKWDGTTWSSLGSGVNDVESASIVRSLAVDGAGNIYAGGEFDSIGGIAVNHIAKWNGTSWSSLGSGMDSAVLAVTVDDSGNLYAGGSFSTVNGIQMHHIAKWDGTAWSALGDDVDYIEKYNCGLSVDNAGNVYMSGSLTLPGGPNYLLKWNGETWSAFGDGLKTVISLYIDASGSVFAGGYDMISKWDGSAWSPFGCYGTNSWISALAVDSCSNLYAGGNFSVIGTAATGIARWDGSKWCALENQAENGETFLFSSNLALGGCGIVYAIGYISGCKSIAKWNGSNWYNIESTISYYTTTLAVDRAGNLYAGGKFDSINSKPVNSIAVWDGTEWHALGNGLRSSSQDIWVTALAFDKAGNLYAAGLFDTAGDVAANNIARWDGNSWSALGSGIKYLYDIPVNALAFDSKGNLYAGGYFDTAGGVAAKNIAKWDGNAWSALGSGIDHVVDLDGQTGVFALTVDKQDNLYAGGGFDTIGEIPANFIARWDGTTWSALGSGVFGGNLVGMNQSCVFALAIDNNNNLYAGGEFLSAGQKISPYIAKCNLNSVACRQPRIVSKHPSSSLAYDSRTRAIRFNASSAAIVSYRIYTLSGRELIHNAVTLPAGANSFRIKTTGLCSGVYSCLVSAGRESIRFPMMVDGR